MVLPPLVSGAVAGSGRGRWLPRLAALALVLAWPFALFGPAVAAGMLLAPGDGLGYYLPTRAIAALGWLAGEPPFWNPFHFGGMPLLAAIQAGAFFPGNLPFLLLAPGPAMNATVLLAYATAGAGAWAYATALGLPAAATLLAGLAFMGAGYMVAHLEHLTMLQAAGLIPWLFCVVERAGATGRARWALLLAPLLALQLFAGYPQTTMITGLMLAPYALARVWGRGPGPGGAMLGWLGLAAALGVGLAAIQLLPTADLMAASPRGRVPYAELVDHSWPIRELPTMLFPFMFGAQPGGLASYAPWGAGPWRNELVGYAGLATLALAALGLRAAWAGAAAGVARYWAVVAPIAALLALGGQTPLYKLWAKVPGLQLARVPGRHLLELDFALAMLAALGLAWLLQAKDKRDRAWAAGLALGAVALPAAAVLLGLALGRGALAARWQAYAPTGLDVAAALAPVGWAFWLPVGLLLGVGGGLWLAVRRPAIGGWALVAVAALDLGLFGWNAGWRALIPADAATYQRPALSDGPRTLAVADYPFLAPARADALRYPQTGALLGAKLVNGYEPIMPTAYARIAGRLAMGGGVGDPEVLGLDHHALDVLGARWVRFAPEKWALAPWNRTIADHPRWDRLPDEGPVVVFMNHRALPRAWRPTRVVGRTATQIAWIMRDETAFDPRRTALLEGTAQPGPAWTPGQAWARTTAPNRLRVKTTGTGPGLVVVSEAWSPGWTARIGERALPVLQVDGLVLGVEVPGGEQVVELAYAPPAWGRAWRTSAVALALWGLALLGAAWLSRRRRVPVRGWR